jgi:hypothetical protein
MNAIAARLDMANNIITVVRWLMGAWAVVALGAGFWLCATFQAGDVSDGAFLTAGAVLVGSCLLCAAVEVGFRCWEDRPVYLPPLRKGRGFDVVDKRDE